MSLAGLFTIILLASVVLAGLLLGLLAGNDDDR